MESLRVRRRSQQPFFLLLCISMVVLNISQSGASDTVTRLPWDKQDSNPKHPTASPSPQTVTMDSETLEALVEFQEIITEGLPQVLKLVNRLMRNKFARPLIEVLSTCDKQRFMESCAQRMFQKVMSTLTEMPQPAKKRERSHDHVKESVEEDLIRVDKVDTDSNPQGLYTKTEL